ncbi:ROK family protein [Dyadobacter sp. 32]|uniref:ROK family protein n=1 Tax=Dyadobacter sp. 32 TaxID=538966 RepID=UPI0011EBB142
MKAAIGIDLGGTNVKGILLSEEGEVLEQHYMPTNEHDGQWKARILAMVNHLRQVHGEPIEAIGLSSPGFANDANKCIEYLPGRLPGIENFIWEDYFGTTTFVMNDAHAALIAEAKFGEIRGFKNAILLTLGTGVGGGILINGELYQGLSQMAGHFGHTSINPSDDELSILGIPGSLEYAIGNYSIKRRSLGKFQSTQELVDAFLRNEPFATWLWLDLVRKLAIAISSFGNSFSPEIIVLSGGITNAGESLFSPLQSFVDLYEFRPKGKVMPIKQARFSDLSGAVGAAAFAFSKI